MPTNEYGNGTNSTSGANTIVHYYDRAGVESATEVNVYGQFADRKSMPQKYGKTYKVSKWLHIYDREPSASGDFAKYGYLTSRDIADVTNGLMATDGTGAALTEGAGATNKRSVTKITMETSFASYGEMVPYTDEVELFSEDYVQVQYRKELGHLANRRYEDLIQLDMLGTTNVMYSGVATSMETMGDGINADGSQDDLYRVDFDLIRKASRKLVRNRAKKNTKTVTGSVKVDTRTVNKAFYAIIGPEVKYDLETITDPVGDLAYIPAYKYASATNLAEGEVGAMHDIRFIESESQAVYRGQGAVPPQNYVGNLSITGATDLTSADVANRGKFDLFPVLFPTEGSFATVGLKGRGKIKFMSQSPEKVELSNPYGTQGFFSYRFWYAGIILQDEKLLKVLVCAGE